jgi:hypothetical protein
MTSAYEPRGFVAAAIAHLEALPTGTWLASAPLADAIGVSPASEMHSILAYAVKHGRLRKQKVDGLSRWAIGDGVPLPLPKDDELDDEDRQPPAPQRSAALAIPMFKAFASKPAEHSTEEAKPEVTKPSRRGTKSPQSGTRPRKSGTPATDETPVGPLRIALWDDGVLDIRRGDAPAKPPYSLDETRQIVRYLDRLCVEELRGGEAA